MAKGGHIARVAGRRLDQPRLHVVWKTWPVYIALYKDRKGNKVVVKAIGEPEEVRKFKVHGGVRNFKLVKYKRSLQEVPIVARATKKPARKNKSTVVTDDEIDELESVDELEEDEDLEDDELDEDEEDEEEDEDEDDDEPEDEEDEDDEEDDDEEEDEAPPKRASKPRKSRAAADGMIGTNEIAKKAGVDSRTLRMVLRKHKVPKDAETRRYQWKSWNDKTVKKILKWLEAGEADDVKTESLNKLKETQAAKKAESEKAASKSSKKNGGKKSSKAAPAKKRRKRVVEDDDDE